MPVDDDMTVFFNTDFTSTWTRLAGIGAAAVQFFAIRGVRDVDALQGYTFNAETEIMYITADVDLHDQQQLQEAGKATVWRVQGDPVRTIDGATSTARIGLAPV